MADVRCKCGFLTQAEWRAQEHRFPLSPGNYSREHRHHHDVWAATSTTPAPTAHDLTDLYVRIDQLIAHHHGGPAPELTPGAQAILTRQALENR